MARPGCGNTNHMMVNDVFLAVMSGLLFVAVGGGVITYTALRHDSRR